MPVFVLILAAVLLAGTISVRRVWKRFEGDRQKSWLIRVSLFSFFGLLFLAVLILPLPNKQRLLAIVPAFFLIAVASRVFKAAKARVQNTPVSRGPDIERLKRLN
jgi:drug/metabolite transporter (DMT)-like permease